jgi:twinfilin-like protein
MLFASTRLTLLRELGGEHFPETVFCTEADELTEEGWARHLAHEKEKNPLTKEEQDLEDIKHAESLESRGTQGRSLTQGGKLALRADSDSASALSTLGEGGRENLVQLRMDGKTETLQLASVSSASPSSLATAIDASEPRFSFYRYDDAEGSIVFVSTCPSKAKIKDRMLYAASRSNVLLLAQNEGGLTVAKRIEATNPEEITEAVLREEFKTADVEEKKSFARPKRPGRK